MELEDISCKQSKFYIKKYSKTGKHLKVSNGLYFSKKFCFIIFKRFKKKINLASSTDLKKWEKVKKKKINDKIQVIFNLK